MTSSFYRFMSSASTLEMEELERVAYQLTSNKALCCVGNYSFENFEGIEFCWLSNRVNLFFCSLDLPTIVLLCVPTAILDPREVESRLNSAFISNELGKNIDFSINSDMDKITLVELKCPSKSDLIKFEFSEYYMEESNKRNLSIPISSINFMKLKDFEKLEKNQILFSVSSGIWPNIECYSFDATNYLDKALNYFEKILRDSL